jgi:phosphatidylinositol-3-phosphatase
MNDNRGYLMKRTVFAAAAVAVLAGSVADAVEQTVPPSRFGRLDHVFLIMMENQTNTDILGNSNAPFINWYVNIANQATNYFGVGHPSAPNYLEIVGGSNFGLTGDFWPVWVNGGCVDHEPNSGCGGAFTPIATPGMDNTVVATAKQPSDCNNQITLTGPPVTNNCALYTYPSAPFTPKSIADQLVAQGRSWKTYQESLPTVPLTGGTGGGPPPLPLPALGVNYSDGMWSNLSPTAVFTASNGNIQKLYAVKHNPFAYFQNIEMGTNPALSFMQVVDFDGDNGLWADLASGHSPASDPRDLKIDGGPNLWFIVPNQCHDMHGFVSGGTPICSANTAAQAGFLMQQGDAEVNKLINAIHASKAWRAGRNAIVLVWDENDFSNAINRVVMTVETNYAQNGIKSNTAVDHFSLLRTLETGFGLPCLNHACDATSLVMNDMFGAP